jgi:hypothetical protein
MIKTFITKLCFYLSVSKSTVLFSHDNIYLKVKCKGHNFFKIYTFLDNDFSTLIENRNNFRFSQAVCAKSSGKLTCLKPREISVMLIPL